MAQRETRRGYKIAVLSPGDTEFEEMRRSQPAGMAVAPPMGDVQEMLLINGSPVPFTKGSRGYNIYYMPPRDSLMDAARSFVDTQPEKDE